WLNSSITDNLFEISGFILFRQDRKIRKGGGVCVWVKSSLNPIIITPSSKISSNSQIIFVNIEVPKIFLITLYAPPNLNSKSKQDTIDYIMEVADNFLNSNTNHHIVIAGDFNHLDFKIFMCEL